MRFSLELRRNEPRFVALRNERIDLSLQSTCCSVATTCLWCILCLYHADTPCLPCREEGWYSCLDSNQGRRIQSPACLTNYTTGVRDLRVDSCVWRNPGAYPAVLHNYSHRGIIRLTECVFASYITISAEASHFIISSHWRVSTSHNMYVIISIYMFRSVCGCKWKNSHTHLRKHTNNAEIVQ